jgi:hypothetical protein
MLRRSPRALRGLPSASLVRRCDPPAILSCGSAFFRVPSGSPCPPPRAPLLGFQPPCLRAFSAQRTGTFVSLRRPARGVSSCVGRLPPSPPEGIACRRRWTLARHLSCAFRARGRSRVHAALQSLLRRRRSRPLAKPRAPFEVLGSSSLQRLRRARPARCGRPLVAVPLVKLPSAAESSRDEK